MGYRVVMPDGLEFVERPHEAHEPARWTADITDASGLQQTRARVWRYSPGARGRRHAERLQEETFVVLSGALTLVVEDPPQRVSVPTGGVAVVQPGTPLQLRNEGEEDAVIFAYGAPPVAGQVDYLPDVD